MQQKPKAPRVLACVLDFDRWQLGCAWSYASSYAVLDGLRAQGADVVAVPSLMRPSDPTSNPWVEAAPSLLKRQRFDQVWVWITHSHYPAGFWEWIRDLAPVRVGVLMESLRYTEEEIADSGHYAGRFDAVATQLRHMTHVLSYDECDVAEITRRLGLPARLYHLMLPAQLISAPATPDGDKLIFLGTVYPKRQRFLDREGVSDLVEIAHGPETKRGLDARFDEAHDHYLAKLAMGGATLADMQAHVRALQEVRREILLAVFGVYRTGFAVANLPALFKAFPSRVLEAMAAGVPVITNRITDRPETASLFEDGKDIFYYDASAPGDFRRAAERLRNDPALRSRLAASAHRRVLEKLTSETQIAAILDWIVANPSRERASATWLQRLLRRG